MNTLTTIGDLLPFAAAILNVAAATLNLGAGRRVSARRTADGTGAAGTGPDPRNDD